MKAIYLTTYQHKMLKFILEGLRHTNQCNEGHIHLAEHFIDEPEYKELEHRINNFAQDLN